MSDSTALTLTLPAVTSDHRQHFRQEDPLLSLYEVFATLPDPRFKHGQRYELAYLLICLVAALRGPCDSTLAVGAWCREQRRLLTRLFGPRRFLCPSDSLDRKLLPRLDAQHIEWTLADWIRTTLGAQAQDPIAWDGKTVPGARKGDQPALLPHPSPPGNEARRCWSATRPMRFPWPKRGAPCLPLAGRVCTADALPTQKHFFLAVDADGEEQRGFRSKRISPTSTPIWPPLLLIHMPALRTTAHAMSSADASKCAVAKSVPR